MKLIVLLSFLISSTILAKSSTPINLTSQTYYYLDKTSKLTQNSIKAKDAQFKKIVKPYIATKKLESSVVWLKFFISNNSMQDKKQIIEYEGSTGNKASLYDFKNYKIDIIGSYDREKIKKNKGYFKISIPANSSINYYMKIEDSSSKVRLDLLLWEADAYNQAKREHFDKVFFFNIAIGILILYNLIIYLFTRDKTYIYYVLVTFSSLLFSISYHLLHSNGFIIFHHELILPYGIKATETLLLIAFIFTPLYARSFLQLKVLMPQADRYLKYLPLGFIFITLLSFFDLIAPVIFNLFFLIGIVSVIIIASLALMKGVKQARYYIFAWMIIASAFASIMFFRLGWLDFNPNNIHVVQLSLLFEALVLSIGLSARVHYEKEKKELLDAKLIAYQKEETTRLEQEVAHRTQELEEALSLKNLLFKEVHHRVKNNMQIIISLLRLQADSLDDEKLYKAMEVSEQRIKAMASVHEMLYGSDDISEVDTKEYFNLLVKEAQNAYDIENNIEVTIQTDEVLSLDQAIYVGLILNEMLTNAFKYAFDTQGGKVNISLTLEDKEYILVVSDNGRGGVVSTYDNSLGMILIQTLTKSQLKGTLETSNKNGICHTVKFLKEKNES